jgi:hypothetical protein
MINKTTLVKILMGVGCLFVIYSLIIITMLTAIYFWAI